MPPSISVVIPVYNRFELLKRSVESVLSQTLPVSEVVLVDDGSSDGTSEILPKYIAQNERWRERVRYLYQENQGPAAARNTGIAQARGDWLAFNDDDDLWLPQKLEWQFHALDQFKECQACFTDAWFMNNSNMKMTLFQLAGKFGGEAEGVVSSPAKYMTERGSLTGIHPVWVQTLVARTALARPIGGFDRDLLCGEDDDFLFRLGCETKLCFVGSPMVLIERTPADKRHEGVSRNWDETEFRLRMAQSRYEKRLHMRSCLATDIRELARRDLSSVHSAWTNWYLTRGQYAEARKSIVRAARFRLSPGIAAKLSLTFLAPVIARRAVNRRDARRVQRTMGFA